MKNSNFKNSFVSTLVVTVVGVLLFGVNAALSETPIASPPGDSVAPTFSGLTVNGGTSLTSDVTISGNISNPSGAVTVNDSLTVSSLTANSNISANANIIVTGNVEVGDAIKNPNAVTGTYGAITLSTPPVKVEGDLKITDIEAGAIDTPAGNLEVNGKIFNWKKAANDSDLPVSILDNLDVDFDLTVDEDIDAKGIIKNSSTDPAPVKIDDDLEVTGDLTVNENIDAKGAILNTATETTIGLTSSPVELPLPVTIDDSVVINGGLSLPGGISGNLSATGKITAVGGIGTFTRFISDSDGDTSNEDTPYTVNAGGAIAKTLSCPAGSKVISCQVKPAEVTGSNIQNFSLSAYMNDALTYCQATVHNGSTTEKKFFIYQICFDYTQ
ncbi:hypothetical protein A3B60_00905 [Candidatus Peregrinibacteria bacterium RIFCSPLOWO2_01_FULL_39_12]|nr:MAG: hypothetical protein A3B60_00905 [Candidatus Peregrinibacteria bacterium RIFCSPLOWO2_01_FULL_39_12]